MSDSILFIVNTAGGGGRCSWAWKAVQPRFQAKLAAAGYKVRVATTCGPGDAARLAAEAAAQRSATIVAAVGGDGTVHEVVNGLMNAAPHSNNNNNFVLASGGGGGGGSSGSGSGRHPHKALPALAVVPLGTASDFCKSCGWSQDPGDALDRILGGQQQPIDLVHVTQTKRPVAPGGGDPVVGAAHNTTPPPAASTARSQRSPVGGRTTPCLAHPNLQQCGGGTNSTSSGGGGGSGDWSCYCINIASCGASAYAVAAAPRWKVLGAWGYKFASLQALLTWRPTPSVEAFLDHKGDLPCDTSISTNTDTRSSRGRHGTGAKGSNGSSSSSSSSRRGLAGLTLLAAGNGSYFGAGMRICPGASPTSGRLQVVSICRYGFWEFLTKGHLLRSGRHLGLPRVTASSCQRATVHELVMAGGSEAAAAAAAGDQVAAGQGSSEVSAARASQQQAVRVRCLPWEGDGELLAPGWVEVAPAAPLLVTTQLQVIPAALRVCGYIHA